MSQTLKISSINLNLGPLKSLPLSTFVSQSIYISKKSYNGLPSNGSKAVMSQVQTHEHHMFIHSHISELRVDKIKVGPIARSYVGFL